MRNQMTPAQFLWLFTLWNVCGMHFPVVGDLVSEGLKRPFALSSSVERDNAEHSATRPPNSAVFRSLFTMGAPHHLLFILVLSQRLTRHRVPRGRVEGFPTVYSNRAGIDFECRREVLRDPSGCAGKPDATFFP